MITVLAGGVGAARFLSGLQLVIDPTEVTAIVNTADDVRLHGLAVSPDLDTVTYTLAGEIDRERGWGLAGETWQAMGALQRFGSSAPATSRAGITWFRLGDRDLATHLYRTQRLSEGAGLGRITEEIASAFGVGVRLLPMTEQPVATMLTVPGVGEIGFQDYFVACRHAVPITSVRFAGADDATPGPGVLTSLEMAALVVIAPSNPVVSIGPILAVPGLRAAVAARRSDVVAVSPIVAGAALKGPADRMLAELGHEVSVVGVARAYRDVASALVIDRQDVALAERVEAEGLRPIVADTVMRTPAVAAALASAVLATTR